MEIYCALIGLVFLLSPITKTKIKFPKKKYLGKELYLAIMVLIILLIMGLRNLSVGVDTAPYYRSFLRIGIYNSLLETFKNETNSIPVYLLLCRIIHLFSDDATVFIFSLSFFVCINLYIFIKLTSKDYVFSIFLFIGTTLFFFGMNGTRQTISVLMGANALVLLSRDLHDKRGWLLFLLSIGIHIITLILLPGIIGIFLTNREIRTKYLLGAFAAVGAVSSLILIFFSARFAGFFSHYDMYLSGTAVYALRGNEGSGRIIIIYLYLAIFIVLWLLQKNKLESENDRVFNRLLPGIVFGLFLGIFNSKTVLINRIVWYYIVFFISFIPHIISKCKPNTKLIISTGTYVGFLAYSFLFVNENQGAIVPYLFFWQ